MAMLNNQRVYIKYLGIISIVLTYLWLYYIYIYIIYGNNMVIDLHGGSSIFSGRHVANLDGIIRMSQLDGHGMGQAGHLHMVPSLGPSCLSSKYTYIYIIYIYIIYICICVIYIYMGRCYTSIIHGCVIYISNISNISSFLFKQN